MNNDMKIKVPVQISIVEFRLRVFSTGHTELNTKLSIEVANKYVYIKCSI